MAQTGYIVVNFGGPRNLKEIEPFLKALLTDRDVIRTKLPGFIHDFLFSRIAAKRAKKIRPEYALMGGGSPIWADTESIRAQLELELQAPVLAFHRYLPVTHAAFIERAIALPCQEMIVFPFFPQFSWATTGSIARFFATHLPKNVVKKLRWVKSYPDHPTYIATLQKGIEAFLVEKKLAAKECFFLFSAHGLPEEFVQQGDLYAYECARSFQAVMEAFPHSEALLCFQSKFGRGEWLKPYTVDVATHILHYNTARKPTLVVPISFTSDHIETLIEIERQYLPLIEAHQIPAYRVPALNGSSDWIAAILSILKDFSPSTNHALIR